MKHHLLPALLTLVVPFAGCASTSKRPTTFTTPKAASDTPPRKGNHLAAYAYAQNRMAAADYAEAAIYFTRAAEWVPAPGTDDGLWEFENFLNAAWAWLVAGDKAGAGRTLAQAAALQVQAAPSDRFRYLESLLTGTRHAALPPGLKNTLP